MLELDPEFSLSETTRKGEIPKPVLSFARRLADVSVKADKARAAELLAKALEHAMQAGDEIAVLAKVDPHLAAEQFLLLVQEKGTLAAQVALLQMAGNLDEKAMSPLFTL